MTEVVIAGAARTPIGSFGGGLAAVNAVDLGVTAAVAAMERAHIAPDDVEEVIVGNVLSAGLGQNVARQVLVGSGIPQQATGMTLNMVCGSGLRAVSLAAQVIAAGGADVVLAGGTESMSNAPYLLNGHRTGHKMGNDTLVDSMICDGLWDVFNDYHMGVTAENVAAECGISREAQDEFSLESQQKAQQALESGRFRDEIVPVQVPQRKGEPIPFDTDEYPRFNSAIEKFAKLQPAFKKEGTVTAGNASGINDGAAMLVLCSRDYAGKHNLPALAVVRSYASAGVAPAVMGLGVVPASQKALAMAHLGVGDLDLAEVNEAFAAQAVAATQQLGIPMEKINVNGGAIALGHPIGASGARILTTLLYEMGKRKARHGLAALCIGGGMGTAIVVERE